MIQAEWSYQRKSVTIRCQMNLTLPQEQVSIHKNTFCTLPYPPTNTHDNSYWLYHNNDTMPACRQSNYMQLCHKSVSFHLLYNILPANYSTQIM